MNNVEHPSHYNLPGKKECIVEMEENYGLKFTAVFCLMNAYKYLYRAGHKDDYYEDVKKAKWYFDWVKNRGSELSLRYLGRDDFNMIEKMYYDIQKGLGL